MECLQKRLAAASRIDGHHDGVVEVSPGLRKGLDRRRGVQHGARLRSSPPDRVQAALEVAGRFDVHGNPVGARVEVAVERFLRVFDHQVDVDREGGSRA